MKANNRLALIGANGMLAQMVKKVAPPSFEITAFDLPELDITNQGQVLSVIKQVRPDFIVNCAAYTNVDGCETNEGTAFRVNGAGPGYLAEAALEVGAVLVHISTDYVFAGDKNEPYLETDATGPLSAYGRTKLEGEKAILNSGLKSWYIVRTSWLYGPGGKNFVETIIRLAGEREGLRVVADQYGSPTYTEDLAHAIFQLLKTLPASGIYHFSNNGSCNWHEFAEEIVKLARVNKLPVKAERIIPIRTEEYPLPAKRPSYSVFSKHKYEAATGETIPEWRESLIKYFAIRQTK